VFSAPEKWSWKISSTKKFRKNARTILKSPRKIPKPFGSEFFQRKIEDLVLYDWVYPQKVGRNLSAKLFTRFSGEICSGAKKTTF